MISKPQFKKICDSSKFFLKTNFKNIVLLSVKESHIIRPHPVFLKNYHILFEKFFYFKIFCTFTKNFTKVIFFFILNFFKKKIVYKFNKKNDYIFVSHFLNKCQISEKKKKDFYFSHFFKCKIKNSSLILLNHLKKNFNAKNKIIINSNENFWYEIKLLIKLFCEILRFRRNYSKKNDNFYKKYLYLIFSNIFSVSTLDNLRIYYQFKKILEQTKPKKIIVTFEGHPFERNIFLAASNIDLQIEKIGFHHSIPFENQFSYTLKLKNGSDPDTIMSSGKSSYKKFSKIKICNTNILVGSNRILKNLKITKKNQFNKIINCLVIPEGIESETELLLNFCKEYLLKFNNINFVIRLHPILKSKINKYKNYFAKDTIGLNVLFSMNNNQSQDIKKCKIALYRGTSLIFDAVKNGLVPFYYQEKNELNFDPLLFSSKRKNQSINISNIYELNKKINDKKIFKKNYYFEAYSYPDKKKIRSYFC